MRGFYLMHRGWLDHPAFGVRKREPFCRAAAWCWLVEEAAYEPRRVRVGSKVIDLRRGQLTHSLRFMAEAWGWQHDRCRRFIADLKREGMITTANATDNATAQIVISICNYVEYQDVSADRATADATADATASATSASVRQPCDSERDSQCDSASASKPLINGNKLGSTEISCDSICDNTRGGNATDYKERNKLKEKKDSPSIDRAKRRPKGSIEAEFAEFYQAYPRHVGRAAAYRKYVIARQRADAETLLTAAKRFTEISAGKELRYVAHPATWLHDGRWQDEDVAASASSEWHDPGPDEPPPIENWRVTTQTGGPH